MKQLTNDMTEIRKILGDKYNSRNKAFLVCLADEKTHHILYSGDNYELGNLLAYAVALFAKDESADDLRGFLDQFITSVYAAYQDELKPPSENTYDIDPKDSTAQEAAE